MNDVEGFILAGGASSRMGTDKAHLRLGEMGFVERIAGALSVVSERISVVSSRPDAGAWGLPVVPDIFRGCGALGAIHAALSSSKAEWAWVVSCDLPFVTPELLARLASRRNAGLEGEVFEAVVPVQPDGRVQPLCALYARAAALTHAAALLRAGELRPRELTRLARTRLVAFEELGDLAGAPLFFVNVNTPEDYAHALRCFAAD